MNGEIIKDSTITDKKKVCLLKDGSGRMEVKSCSILKEEIVLDGPNNVG